MIIYKKGQVIFFEGDISDKLYIINKGKIKVFKYTKEGKEQILYILSEGVNVCTLTKDDFDKILKENPHITLKILEDVHDKIVGLENLIQRLSTKDVESRLAGALISFIKDFGKDTDKGIELAIPLGREDLANYIGITRETISRKLSSMQDEGIIALVGNKKIIIKNLDLLEDLA